jgi:ubiquinone/menaquinone biosynthesis C-methylase UbiE
METTKFTGKADVYTKFRPAYPNDFIDYLYHDVGFNENSSIADIGSGTGKFSKQLLLRQSNVLCVEPNDDMRQIAEEELAPFTNFVSIRGTAEDTTIQQSSVDFITVAQAFHWFNKEMFKRECQRILKPKGKVVLVWNSRVASSELVIENRDICQRLCINFKGFSGGQEEDAEAFSSFFKDGNCEYQVFENDLTFDKNTFIGRNLSASYAPKAEDSNYNPYVEALSELFDKYSVNGVLIMPNATRSYIGLV